MNLTVFSLKTKRTLLPWQISSLHPPTLTFQEMYYTQLKSINPAVSQYDHAQVYIGKAKDALDLAEPSMVVSEEHSLYEPLCIFCCSNEELTTKDGCYPQCKTCSSREPIKKRK